MICRLCNLPLLDGFQCKVQMHKDKKEFDYVHPGCWIVWNKCQIKLQKLSEAYEFKLGAIKSNTLFIIDEVKEDKQMADEDDRFINSSIPSIQEDVLTLRNENELLKSKLSKIENVCSQYVSNELAYKIKEIVIE